MSAAIDRSQDLPNQWACSLDFEKKITCMCLNPSGNILAVGLESNPVIVCDSETSSNRHFFTEHDSSPMSLSFSSHSHFLASGDKQGVVIVRRVLDGKVLHRENFGCGIVEVLFSPIEPETLLVLDKGHKITLLNLKTKQKMSVESDFVSVCWHPVNNFIFAAGAKDIHVYDSLLNEKKVFSPDPKKFILKIEMSNKGMLLLIIEKNGGCLLYQIEAQSAIHTFQDHVGSTKWTSAVFDPKDEIVVFASNEMGLKTLTMFSIVDSELGILLSDLQGPNEPVGQIIYHPFHPVIYTRGIYSIRVWTPTFLNSWSKFMPGFVDAIANDLYYEREDEFDEEEEVPEPDKIEHDEEINIFDPPPKKSIFNSPYNLNYLPLDINALIQAQNELNNNNAQEKL